MVKNFDPDKDIKKILEEPFWIKTVSPNIGYTRLHDDHDGTFTGSVSVLFDEMGDARMTIDSREPIRFRTWGGGGMSLRVRTALLILAEAIRLDNEERPQ